MAKKRRNRNKNQTKNRSATPSKASSSGNGSAATLKALSSSETKKRLGDAKGWEFDQDDGRLVRDFAFGDFKAALAFVVEVGTVAEEMDHHPEIYNVYNQVSLALMTHSVNGISELDFELASRINKLS